MEIKSFLENPIPHKGINSCSCMFNKDVINKIGLRTEKYSTHADFEFSLKLIFNCNVINTKDVTYIYNQHDSSMVKNAFSNQKELELFNKLRQDYISKINE